MFLSLTYYEVFCADLLWRVVESSTVSVDFCVDSSDNKVRSNIVIRSNTIRQYSGDLNLRYFRNFGLSNV